MSRSQSFFIQDSEEATGPFTIHQLQTKWQMGEIHTATLLCREGEDEWFPVKGILGQIDIFQSPSRYYVLLGDAQSGPYTIEQLRSMWQQGTIHAGTMLCSQRRGDTWFPASAIESRLTGGTAIAWLIGITVLLSILVVLQIFRDLREWNDRLALREAAERIDRIR